MTVLINGQILAKHFFRGRSFARYFRGTPEKFRKFRKEVLWNKPCSAVVLQVFAKVPIEFRVTSGGFRGTSTNISRNVPKILMCISTAVLYVLERAHLSFLVRISRPEPQVSGDSWHYSTGDSRTS